MEEKTEYEKWIDWRVGNNEEPMTSTQSLLAQEILGNEVLSKMLSQPGNLMVIMENIQKFLKK